MPSRSPAIDQFVAARLFAFGQQIRQHRKLQKVSAEAAAEAAGMSRVTLGRIERGEPSVTMGAYMGLMAALGLDIALLDPSVVPAGGNESAELPERIRVADYPALARLAWQLDGDATLTPTEALATYERNWRHVDTSALTPREHALLRTLATWLGGGRLLV